MCSYWLTGFPIVSKQQGREPTGLPTVDDHDLLSPSDVQLGLVVGGVRRCGFGLHCQPRFVRPKKDTVCEVVGGGISLSVFPCWVEGFPVRSRQYIWAIGAALLWPVPLAWGRSTVVFRVQHRYQDLTFRVCVVGILELFFAYLG